MRSIDTFIFHATATPPSADIGFVEVNEWHKARGWLDPASGISCGYHILIRRDGKREYGRPLSSPGAHAKGYNAHSIGIALVGGVMEDGKTPDFNFTQAQMAEMERCVLDLDAQFPNCIKKGHRDLPDVTKACPCFDVTAWFSEMER